MVAPMTQASLSKRRGQGEDSIYWDASKNRYIGAVSLGFSPVWGADPQEGHRADQD